MLDKTAVIDTARKYSDEVKKHYDPFAIVVFGSHINGGPHENSDIDVAVVFDGFNGNWYDTNVNLWRISERISLDIEPHLLDTTKDITGFADYVLRTGDIIYRS